MALFGRVKNFFDPQGVNKSNVDYVAQQQGKRAAGELGLSEGQKEALVSRGQEQVGSATQAALSQMPTTGMDAATQQRMFQGAVGGLQQGLAQQKQGADMASEEHAANAAAELNALEQGVFQRRKDKRDFFVDATGKAVEIAGSAAMMCWVAIVLWGERDERTLDARWYANNTDNWFTRMYRVRGVRWSQLMKRYPVLKLVAWPIWRAMAWRGRQMLNNEVARG